jgi:hypothetical protein
MGRSLGLGLGDAPYEPSLDDRGALAAMPVQAPGV